MKSSTFWDTSLCSPLKVNRRFGGICHLHLHSQRISQTRNQHEVGSKETPRTLNGLHGVMSQKISLLNHRCENLKSYIFQTYFHMLICFKENKFGFLNYETFGRANLMGYIALRYSIAVY
jgi:hypothetical protein